MRKAYSTLETGLLTHWIGAIAIGTHHHRIHPDTVRAFLSYTAETGLFHWLQDRPRARAGTLAGTVNEDGLISIVIRGTPCLGHNLAWLLTHGAWPPARLLHVNGVTTDNRIANLSVSEGVPTRPGRIDAMNGTLPAGRAPLAGAREGG